MAWKLNKAELTRRNALYDEIMGAGEDLLAAVAAYNEAMAEQAQKVQEALDAYNSALSDARDFRDEIVGDRDGDYQDKSEAWQEGDKGQAVRTWIDEWEGAELDEVEIEFPEELEEPDLAHADALNDLPEEAE